MEFRTSRAEASHQDCGGESSGARRAQSGQTSGAHRGVARVTSRSSTRPFAARKGHAASLSTMSAPATAGFAPAATSAWKVPRSADPALIASSTIATRLSLSSGATVFGKPYATE